MNIDIRQLLRNCPDALKEFEALPYPTDAWFDLAFGVTPSLFVAYGDSQTERIRLFDEKKTREWLKIGEIQELKSELALLKSMVEAATAIHFQDGVIGIFEQSGKVTLHRNMSIVGVFDNKFEAFAAIGGTK